MANEKLWYKDAIIYELHVRSFCDSTGDGIGDFRGLIEKLSYFEELGVTAIWLLPFYPSPLRDDGYDIADYYSVNPSYGSLDDFKAFLDAAHRRGIRVITELVINHTSDQHAWFQRARLAPEGSSERDFYVWSDTPAKFEDARIIFTDFESSNWSWDPVARSYFWHRFYSHQPDLNFDNPAVRQAVLEVLDFWLEMGVDGLRLDAIPYLFEREGTTCENLPETHAYLSELRKHVDEKFPGRMLLAEANQWPEDAVKYFGNGDECHMSFHFPLMPRLFMGIQMEDRFPIIDIMEQTPAIPESCQWAIFLRNHDELTLEMVTDEERDYMYRLYAEDPRARINLGIRRRLAPLLGNNRRKIELINSLLLSMPGTPIIYYGDEIGMGDNFYLGDRNGVRTPMQWSSDRNAGFSRANPQQLFLPVIIDPEFHYEAVNVDMQMKNLSSLFWWMRRIIDIRKRHRAFSQGTIDFLRSGNAKVLAFFRKFEDETILVVANLSRFAQAVQLDLSAYAGSRVEELFSGSEFAKVGEGMAQFTIGPHSFYWLALKASTTSSVTLPMEEIPVLDLPGKWSEELISALRLQVLPQYLLSCRWYGGKQRILRSIRVIDRYSESPDGFQIFLMELAFSDGASMTQAMPMAIGTEDEGDALRPPAVIARLNDGLVVWDALSVKACRQKLWDLVAAGGTWSSSRGVVRGVPTQEAAGLTVTASRILGGEQSNTSLLFDDRFLFKVIRKFEPGGNPDADVLRALGEKSFPYVPKLGGVLTCRHDGEEGVMGVLTEFVPNEGDGWTFMSDAVARYFERVLVARMGDAEGEFDQVVGANIPQRIRQLGERTGALHRCLESITDKSAFAPEPLRPLDQRSLYQSMRNLLRRTEAAVTQKLSELDLENRQLAMNWIAATPRILDAYSALLHKRITATRIRIHGDYHLGQVLNTGNDFIILDFEGEPRRSLSERAHKRSPLVDVAGMLRSLDYALESRLLREKAEDREHLRPWAEKWLKTASQAFLEGYLSEAQGASFLPQSPESFDLLLKLFLLDKAVYEVDYELNYRPDFLPVPMGAASRILGNQDSAGQAHKG